MKKVKKYYPGVNGLTNTQSTGVLAPQENKFSTGKFLFPQHKTLGNIVDNKVMSQDYFDKTKPSFKENAGNFMGKYGAPIVAAAGTLMPLVMKKPDPNAKPYKSGTNMIKTKKNKLIKYQKGNEDVQLTSRNDSVIYKNAAGNEFKTGATVSFNGGKGASVPVKTDTPKTAPIITTTQTSPDSAQPGLYEGWGLGRMGQTGVVGGASALGELFLPKRGKGSSIRKILKYGPTAARTAYDLVMGKPFSEIALNLAQDISAASTGSGVVRFGKGAAKNAKEQIKKTASAKPDVETLDKPYSLTKALTSGLIDAGKGSTIGSLPTKGILWVKETGKELKKAKENVQASLQKRKMAAELEAANTAATNLASTRKHTGPANTQERIGIEGNYYIKGQPVSKEKYTEWKSTEEPKIMKKRLASVNKQLETLVGKGANRRDISTFTPEELKKYNDLQKKKKPLAKYQRERNKAIKEAEAKAAAEAEAARLAAEEAAKKSEKAAIAKKLKEDREKAAAAGKKPASNTSNRGGRKKKSPPVEVVDDDDPPEDVVNAMASKMGLAGNKKKANGARLIKYK